MGSAPSRLQSALVGEAGVPAGSGWEETKRGKGKSAGGLVAGRGSARAARREQQGTGVSANRGRFAGRFCATARCAVSAVAARRRVPDPRGAPGARNRAEESGLGKRALREEPSPNKPSPGPPGVEVGG